MTTERPLPIPDELSAPFWEAIDRKELSVQRCRRCLRYSHPPKAICETCLKADFEFVRVSGRGRVYSYTLVRDQRLPAFDQRVPYVAGKVQLEEQADLIFVSNFPGSTFEALRCGLPVQLEFEEVAPGRYLPQFRVIAR